MRVSTTFIHTRGIQNILEQQAKLIKSQDQLSRGEKNLVPSDNPVAASRIIDLNDALSQIVQLEENAGYATQRLNLEESTLISANNVLQRIRELSIQAANTGANDLQSERAIASEIREKLDELFDYANTRDENGDYIFSGFQSRAQAFTTDGLGNFSYNGDEGQLAIQVGANRQVVSNDSGADIFQMVRNGNGTFSVDANGTNGGSGQISTGTVVTPAQYLPQDFSIEFTETLPTAIPAQFEYSIINETTGVTVQAAQPYEDGGAIAFNGIIVEIKGEPLEGDVFTVSASRNQDIFSALYDLTESLQTPGTGDVRGVIGGDYINSGFDAGDTVAFDLNFDGQAINFSVTPPTPTNGEVATSMMATIAAEPTIIANLDGTFTLPGATAGNSLTFKRIGDNIEFISSGATVHDVTSVVIDNISDTTNDAVLGIIASGNTITTQANLDAAIVGDSASYLSGVPPRSYLSQQIDNALNNIDQSMDRIINVQTSIGARLNSIDSQIDDNANKKIYLETVRSEVKDLDFAEAISNMTFQTTVLQIAQQTFTKVQNLSLFNFI